MYPFTFNTGIVKNRWYMAAFSTKITREPMERTLLGQPVLYRKEEGSPIAMYSLCPHRYFPLARGKVEGDALVCGYRGIAFDADGIRINTARSSKRKCWSFRIARPSKYANKLKRCLRTKTIRRVKWPC